MAISDNYDLLAAAERDLQRMNGDLDRYAKFAAGHILRRRRSIEVASDDEVQLLTDLATKCVPHVLRVPRFFEREHAPLDIDNLGVNDVRYAIERHLRMWAWGVGRSEYDWERSALGEESSFALDEIRLPIVWSLGVLALAAALLVITWSRSDVVFAVTAATVVIVNRLRYLRRDVLLRSDIRIASIVTSVFAIHRRLDKHAVEASDEFHDRFAPNELVTTALACRNEEIRDPRIIWNDAPAAARKALDGFRNPEHLQLDQPNHWATKFLDRWLQQYFHDGAYAGLQFDRKQRHVSRIQTEYMLDGLVFAGTVGAVLIRFLF